MKTWKMYGTLIGILLVFGGGLMLGWRLFRPAEVKREVTAQVILTALRDRGFLVTQTFMFDLPVTIKKSSGSVFKDFFFGQTITARGAMEANLGIDLSNMSADDVAIEGDIVNVKIPRAQLFNVRLVGPIDVKNDQGILKRLLQNDDGYNEAMTELSNVASDAATKQDSIERATDRAKEEITQLLQYVATGKVVRVTVR